MLEEPYIKLKKTDENMRKDSHNITNYMAYGTRRFNTAFTRALQ